MQIYIGCTLLALEISEEQSTYPHASKILDNIEAMWLKHVVYNLVSAGARVVYICMYTKPL